MNNNCIHVVWYGTGASDAALQGSAVVEHFDTVSAIVAHEDLVAAVAPDARADGVRELQRVLQLEAPEQLAACVKHAHAHHFALDDQNASCQSALQKFVENSITLNE